MRLILIAACLALLGSCSNKPEPLNYGKDNCYACKMTLVDQKFGAEIGTKKGKIYKFDDMNCLVGFYKSGVESDDNIAFILATDFKYENALIDVNTASFLVSPDIRSPMASGVAVFSSRDQAAQVPGVKGEILSWDAIKARF